MARTLIRAVLAPVVVQQFLAALQGMANNMPFLTALSPWERRTQPKTGRKRLAFVQKAAEVVRQNPDIVPPKFDGGRFLASADLLSALMSVYLAMQKLFEEVSDTTMEVGIDSYTQALDVYNFVQRLAKTVPGLDDANKDLKRLLRESKKPENPETVAKEEAKKAGKKGTDGKVEPAKPTENTKA